MICLPQVVLNCLISSKTTNFADKRFPKKHTYHRWTVARTAVYQRLCPRSRPSRGISTAKHRCHGIPWYTVVCHGIPWYTMDKTPTRTLRQAEASGWRANQAGPKMGLGLGLGHKCLALGVGPQPTGLCEFLREPFFRTTMPEFRQLKII